MYFDMRSVATPMECAHPTPESAHDCDNVEVTSPDLVVTKLVLSVKGQGPVDGDYGRCNICVNGTDHHGNNSCADGVYWCMCGDYHSSKQCGPSVGLENITESMSKRKCAAGSKSWDCWKDNTAAKTGGEWYSTTSAGYCGDGSSPAPPGCTWSVKEVVKVVNKSCSDDSMCAAAAPLCSSMACACLIGLLIPHAPPPPPSHPPTHNPSPRHARNSYTAVEKYAATAATVASRRGGSGVVVVEAKEGEEKRLAAQSCFETCADSGAGKQRNTSSSCWITCAAPAPAPAPAPAAHHPKPRHPRRQRRLPSYDGRRCFYDTVLGPEAGIPGGKVEGMPLQTLVDAWNKPFLPEAQGGCPALGDAIRRQPPRPSALAWRGFPGFD